MPDSVSVVALAGRRIDAPGTLPPRFPAANIGLVEGRIRSVFEHGVSVLVCSAACGADLLALGVAGEWGIRRRVVLPFDRARFRETSVVDRPGDWGTRYDQILDEVEANGDLIVLGCDPADPEAYAEANRAILDEAVRLGAFARRSVSAVVLWDLETRGADDFVAHFLGEASIRNLPVEQIDTST